VTYDDWKLATPPEYEGGREDEGDEEPPEGWQDAVDTWIRILGRATLELVRNPYSARCILVEKTAYRRLAELMAMRPAPETTHDQ